MRWVVVGAVLAAGVPLHLAAQDGAIEHQVAIGANADGIAHHGTKPLHQIRDQETWHHAAPERETAKAIPYC